MLGEFLLVFFLAAVTEVFVARYVFYAARADPVRGSLASGAVAVLKALLIIQCVREPLVVVVMALGQMIGAYLMLRVIRAKQEVRRGNNGFGSTGDH